ncbi:MAG: hypothetical protein NZL98_07440 [Anaerolineales bacterium]|nr:hypothetical protein [Anaerolineales bacterium]
MARITSLFLSFLLGALTMAVLGLVLALHLTGVFATAEVSGTAPQPFIRVRDSQGVESTRRTLIEFIFGTPNLPETRPRPTQGGMLIHLPNGFTSFLTVSKPTSPNGSLVIYHTGHEGFTARDRAAIRALLKAGYTVWRLDLPLIGQQSEGVQVVLPSFGPLTIREHRQMAYLDEITDGHPLRYFVEPAIAAINQAEEQGFEKIFMIGFSGGGWTTLLTAALDTRLASSYTVAGGLPLSLRFANSRRNWGDWEENLPELFRLASFEDLSILGAAGRSQIQVLNEYDICCYNDRRYLDFAPSIQAVVETLGGSFKIYWSENEVLHRANPKALQVILSDMSSRRSP